MYTVYINVVYFDLFVVWNNHVSVSITQPYISLYLLICYNILLYTKFMIYFFDNSNRFQFSFFYFFFLFISNVGGLYIYKYKYIGRYIISYKICGNNIFYKYFKNIIFTKQNKKIVKGIKKKPLLSFKNIYLNI